jgi:filamentous hemagglutinin family protein
VLSSIALVLYPTLAAAQSVPSGVTQIIPDGRTATTVTTNGSVTGITTTTTAGANAFNSFSQFKVGNGNTANLYVPGGSGNLINLVRNGAVVVDGVLNSYKDGKIGGNVYFADPYGFVVGRSGVVNTGALTVATPTREFIDSLIGPQGQIGAAATDQLLGGNVPLSPDGAIAIRGRINANDGVRLIGQNVVIGTTHEARSGQIAQAAKFAATVNSKGLRNSSGIVVRNGSIQIVAGGDARINGKLEARSRGNENNVTVAAGDNATLGAKAKLIADGKKRDGGTVKVTAGNDIAIASGALLSSKSREGKGGTVTVFADGNTKVESGTRLDVSSKQSDAGFVELSAKNAVTVGAIKLDLTAPNGRAGTLLIDPADLVIDGGSDSTTSTIILSNGGNVILTASSSITITSTGAIDTRLFNRGANGGVLSPANPSVGSSGAVTLTAPAITINGKILTDVAWPSGIQSVSPGNVTLNAANIVIGATGLINGADVKLLADNTIVVNTGGEVRGFSKVVLTAGDSVTIAANGVIDTRNFDRTVNGGVLSVSNPSIVGSGAVAITAPTIGLDGKILTNVINSTAPGAFIGNAGDVTLTANATSSSSSAATTTINVGGTIDAGIVNAFAGAVAGDVRLLATSTSSDWSGQTVANADITISGILTGRDVKAIAESKAESRFIENAPSPMQVVGMTLAATVLGLNGGYVAGLARAHVTAASTTVITAQRDVELKAHATETASDPAMAIGGLVGLPVGAAVVVGLIDGTATARVMAGASIRADRDVTVAARNDATLAVSAIAVSANAIIDVTVAYSKARVNTTADVQSGADIVARNIIVTGANINSFSTSASVFAGGNGSIGGAVAYSDIVTNATANFGGNAGTSSASIAGNLAVEAYTKTDLMAVSASTQVGTPGLVNAIVTEAPAGFIAFLVGPLFGSALGIKGAGALALTSVNLTSNATIGNGTGSAPAIYAAGDVSVISRNIDSAIRNNASSDVTATNSSGTTTVTVSAGVAYGTYRHESNAIIGHGAVVTGRNIGVSATTDLPNENTWVKNWTDGGVGGVISHLNGNFGVVSNILTSYANASGQLFRCHQFHNRMGGNRRKADPVQSQQYRRMFQFGLVHAAVRRCLFGLEFGRHRHGDDENLVDRCRRQHIDLLADRDVGRQRRRWRAQSGGFRQHHDRRNRPRRRSLVHVRGRGVGLHQRPVLRARANLRRCNGDRPQRYRFIREHQ